MSGAPDASGRLSARTGRIADTIRNLRSEIATAKADARTERQQKYEISKLLDDANTELANLRSAVALGKHTMLDIQEASSAKIESLDQQKKVLQEKVMQLQLQLAEHKEKIVGHRQVAANETYLKAFNIFAVY
jgi:chromosome segregation ATPase